MTTSKHIARWALAAVLGAAGPAAFETPASAADMVYRKSAPRAVLLGDLTLTRETVTVAPRGLNPVTVPVDDIARIEWEREPAAFKTARAAEASGKLAEALAQYEKELPNTSGNAAIDTQFLIARATAKLALVDPSRANDAIARLEAFRAAHPDNFRHFAALEHLGEVFLASGQFDKARAAFGELEKSSSPALRMGALNAKARVLQKEGKNDEALAAFDAVIQQPAESPAELSRRHEAMLGRAKCLMAQAKYGEAVTALDTVIDDVAPTDTRNQATAYVLMGDSLRALDKEKDARLAYLHVDVLFQQERPQHAEALYHLARLWSALGDQERANDAAARLSKEHPQSEWARKLTSG
ncbi:MAG: tetratricopeptide repeat protein [Planctomycetaceae bacterium]